LHIQWVSDSLMTHSPTHLVRLLHPLTHSPFSSSSLIAHSPTIADDAIYTRSLITHSPTHPLTHVSHSLTHSLTQEELAPLALTMQDFEEAVERVQPSAKREGFATVPDVKWEDVGSLGDIREVSIFIYAYIYMYNIYTVFSLSFWGFLFFVRIQTSIVGCWLSRRYLKGFERNIYIFIHI